MSTAADTPVLPFLIHQDREQMVMQWIHSVIFVPNLRRLIGIATQHNILGM